MRKTKIVCTMGPSTEKPGILRQLMENGMNVARFNFSHGDYEEHKGRFNALRALSKELDLPVAAMLDTKGPEIRLGTFKNGVEKLVTGQKFTLTSREVEGTNEICSITYKDLPMDVEPNGTIMLDDGLIKLQIQTVNDTDINGLHELNNAKGHQAGDIMLREVADELKKQFGDKLTYRMGGDEYVAFAPDLSEDRLHDKVRAFSLAIEQKDYHAALGWATCETASLRMENLLRIAETRMYQAKSAYYQDKNTLPRGR